MNYLIISINKIQSESFFVPVSVFSTTMTKIQYSSRRLLFFHHVHFTYFRKHSFTIMTDYFTCFIRKLIRH
jgi:hypothetical protein